MKRKILSLFTALTMLMSFMPTFTVTANAAEETQYQAIENGEWLAGSLKEAAANVYDGGTIKALTDICLTETITVSKSLTIVSADKDNPCTITHNVSDSAANLDDSFGIMFNANNGDFKLENIILNGGNQESIYHPLIYILGAEMTLGNGAVIQNNYNRNSRSIGGGAIYLREGKLVMEDGSRIASCICKQGGAVEVNSNINLLEKADFTMNGGSIEKCQALSGGAIYINAGTFHLRDGEIKNNIVTGATYQNGGGGAIFINGVQWSDHTSTAIAYIEGGKIIGNTSNYYGGAIRVNHANAILAMRGGLITENSASFGAGIAGTIGNVLLYGGEITKNTATNFGSGVYCTPNLGHSACYITIAGNIIVKDNVSGNEPNVVSDNVYLDGYEDGGADMSTPVRIIGELGGDAYIGMSRWVNPDDTANPSRESFVPSEAADPQYTITENDLAKIHADDKKYAFILHEGKILMVLAVDIELDKSELTFTDKSQTEQLTATVTPDNTIIKDVTWKSDNEAVATVDDNGVVTPKHHGTCKITATTVSPYNAAASCDVIVDIPHTLVKHDKTEPTCTDKGTEEYWKCEGDNGCGKLFADADGKTEISEIPTIEASSHIWGKWVFTDTGTEIKVVRTCERDSSHKKVLNTDIQLTQTRYTYDGKECKPKAVVQISDGEKEITLTEGTDYTLSYENNKNAGDAKVEITGIGDYSGTIERKFNIAKRTLMPVKATSEGRQYNGTEKVNVTAVELDGAAEGDTVAVNTENLQGTLSSANAGDYTEVTLQNLTLVNNENDNYVLYQSNITIPTEVTIEKADVPPVTAGRLNIANNLEKEYTYLLSRLCPQINEQGTAVQKDWGRREYEIVNVSFTENGYYDDNTAYIGTAESGGTVNNTVYLPIKFNDTSATGIVGEVTVKVVSTNYKDFENSFKIHTENKTAVTFDGVTAKNRVYNGNPWIGYEGNPTAKDNYGNEVSITPEIRYTGRLNTGYSERADAPVNAGTYSVIFRVADNNENYIGKRTLNFEITKADGIGSVVMEDFEEGETPSVPVPLSQTNGTDNVTYKYKQFAEPDRAYTDNKPTTAGKYTLMALFAETQNYNSAFATANFTIKTKPTANPSASPTASPTASPSASPSASPTASPSASPTASPTAKPRRGGGSSVRTTPTPKPTKTSAPVSVPTASPNGTSETSNKHLLYVVGYPDGEFKPDNGISRAEVSAILARLTDGFVENEKYTSAFPDIISGAWYENYVGFEENKNIIVGYPDGEFKPDRFITRAEFAAMIARFADLDAESSDTPFTDISENWAYAQIAACHKAGYIEGYEDNTFRPEMNITRAEAVAIINRVLDRNDIKGFTNPFSDVSETHWAYMDIMEAAITHNTENN